MTNEELLDDYVANRMTEEQRKAFEESLAADQSLRQQAAFHQQVAEGIRRVRAMELKARLQQVPVASPALWQGQVWRAAAAIAGTGALVAASLFYVKSGRTIPTDSLTTEMGKKIPSLGPVLHPAEKPQQEQPQTAPQPEDKDQARHDVKRSIRKPGLSVVDPSAELAEQPAPKDPAAEIPNTQAIAVAGDVSVSVHHNTPYDFHYQFDESGLRLYGPFDKDLFEVLEIRGDGRTCFLFYQNTFYTLAGNQKSIARLEPVTNPRLLQLLREYRQQ
jgi:hypothetical protein